MTGILEKSNTRQFSFVIQFLILGAITVIAWLVAMGTNNLVMMSIYEKTKNVYTSQASVERIDSKKKDSVFLFTPADPQPIFARNIFSSKIGPIHPGETDEADAIADAPPTSVDEMPVIPCENSDNELMATIVSNKSPKWSIAAIANKGEKAIYHTGDEVGNRMLLDISWRHIFLKGEADICYIDMFGENNLKKAHQFKGQTLRAAVPAKFKKDVKVKGKTWVLSKKIARQISAGAKVYTRQLRLRPYKKEGRLAGFRIRRLSSGNPLSAIGLKKDDVLQEINGHQISNITNTISQLAEMKTQKRFTISVLRKGKPETVNIKIASQ